jgi:membrane-associated phospholipid phosphatase
VKQHFLVDVLGGLAVAFAVHAVVFRKAARTQPATAESVAANSSPSQDARP